MDKTMLEYALEYAELGWRVFPLHTPMAGGGCSCMRADCASVGKHPRTMNGVKDATCDKAQIQRWWGMWPEANIGIATGNGLVAVDFDINHDEGKYGDETLALLQEEHGAFPETVMALTGGGGLHYFFRHDAPDLTVGANLLPGLDFRGVGGYVVSAPSLHASGRRYEWEASHEPSDTELAELPAWLHKLLAAGKGTDRGKRFEAPATIREGGRNQTMFKMAASLRSRGLTESAVTAAVWEENLSRCNPPLERREIETMCASAGKYERGDTMDRIQADAAAEEQIATATKGDFAELTDGAVLEGALRIADPVAREERLSELRGRARELHRSREFERLLRAHREALAKTFTAALAGRTADAIELPDCPLPGLKCYGWEVTGQGVKQIGGGSFGGEPVEACSHPIIITERLTNIDTGNERLKLAFYRDKQWKYLVVDKSTVASRQKIIELADAGIQVNSENARLLIGYLHDLEAQNAHRIPRKRCVSRLGWAGKEFVPYVDDVQYDGDPKYAGYFNAVSSSGDYEAWKRQIGAERDQSPIMRILLAASFASPLMWHLGAQVFFLHLWGGTEVGKAQPLDTKIVTPDGYTSMGKIHVGDLVIGGDGQPHRVTGVFPQGKKEVFELTFADGRKTRCCKEHLWTVTTTTRREHGRDYVTLPLREMMKRPIKGTHGYTYRIPLCKPVEFTATDSLPITPYLLGALVGDGCLTLRKNPANRGTSLYFNNSEYDVIGKVLNELNKIGSGMRFNAHTTNQFTITHCTALKEAVISLGLNVKSPDRFIPECYKIAKVKDRRALLAGLLDADGHVTEKGSISYSTSSQRLAEDVCELSRGLGYKATISTFRGAEYVVYISSDGEVVSSKKHSARIKTAKHSRNRTEDLASLALISVEYCGVAPCQCIMVDSDEHTYLCDDFIVTHNTVAQMAAMSVWGNPDMGALLRSYNSTYVAAERMAGFCHSIPLALDEQQTVRNNRYFSMDTLIYNLCEGQGKGRGTKTGSLENMATWRLCVLSSGEGPLTSSKSGGGGKNRVVSVHCKGKIFRGAPGVADFVKENYGHAGRAYIAQISAPCVLEEAKERLGRYRKVISGLERSTDKQAASAAVIAVGHYYSSVFVFGVDADTAERDTIAFCHMLSNYLADMTEVSQVERAYLWVCDWVASNPDRFMRMNGSTEYRVGTGEVWGKESEEGYLIIASVLEEALENAGFIADACKKEFAERGYIIPGAARATKQKRIGGGGARAWCYELVMPTASAGELEDLTGVDCDDPWSENPKIAQFPGVGG